MAEHELDSSQLARHGGAAIQRSQDRLRVLSECTRSFAEATTEPERLLQTIVHRVVHLIADSCAVFLLSDNGEELLPATVYACDLDVQRLSETVLAKYPIRIAEQAAARHLLETGEPLLVPHFDPMNSRRSPEYAAFEKQIGVHSMLLVPLRLRGQSIGMLTVLRYRKCSLPFDEDDRDLAQILCDHAALAIGNSRSYEAERKARAEAETASEALRQSDHMHRMLFDESPFPAFVFEVETSRMMRANAAALELYGYTRDEFVRLSLEELRAPEDERRLSREFAAAGEGDTDNRGLHRRSSGERIHVEGRTHLFSFAGRPARIVVLHDITKHVQAQVELQSSEQRLNSTLEHMLEGYLIIGRDWRFSYVNDTAARQRELPKSQFIGRTPLELFPDFQETALHGALERCLSEREVSRLETEWSHADGTKSWYELNVQPAPDGALILSSDITERKRTLTQLQHMGEQLRQSQKMEAVGRLAGGVAHDFNNVLSVILSYGEIIRGSLDPKDPARENMAEVIRAAQQAADLTRQLLMFSRRQVLEPKVVDLNEMLLRMHNMLQRILGEDVELVSTLQTSLGLVRADPSSLEQVVMNLVVNARDAMPTGGKLTIETTNVQLDEAYAREHLGVRPGPHVMLAVSDTGIGMNQDTLAHIFEPFFTTKESSKGTGLGLSTVFGIAQQSGGSVWVYSELGNGATFKLFLPCVDAVVVSSPPAKQSPRRGHETILLVEDQEQVRQVVRTILQRQGYEVLTACDVADALQIGREHARPIHLLLTDVVMPQMSGPELAKRVLAMRSETRVLCMSGYTDDSIVRHGVLAAEMPFLQKPITPDALARKVREVLDAPVPDGAMPFE
jgi:two-component system cell cycle sensor histidine kinase/response regulator CckA